MRGLLEIELLGTVSWILDCSISSLVISLSDFIRTSLSREKQQGRGKTCWSMASTFWFQGLQKTDSIVSQSHCKLIKFKWMGLPSWKLKKVDWLSLEICGIWGWTTRFLGAHCLRHSSLDASCRGFISSSKSWKGIPSGASDNRTSKFIPKKPCLNLEMMLTLRNGPWFLIVGSFNSLKPIVL